MRCKPACLLLLAISLLGLGPRLVSADVETPEERRQRLEKMSASEKEELVRKKDRFEKLSPDEQARLRKFHEQVSSDPESDKLKGVMVRYCAWLKTLSSEQRGELESLPLDQRVPKIKELMKLQEEESFKRLVSTPLPAEDMAKVFEWLEDYATRNESMLISKLPRDSQRWVQGESNPERRRGRLRFALSRLPSWPFSDALADEEEFKRFVSGLVSPEAQKALEAAREPEKKRLLAQKWLRAAVMARTAPPVTDAELQRFYAEELDSAKREALERLPREEMQKELRRLYNWQKLRQPPPPGRGPPPPR